jgi:hypothetical protein
MPHFLGDFGRTRFPAERLECPNDMIPQHEWICFWQVGPFSCFLLRLEDIRNLIET